MQVSELLSFIICGVLYDIVYLPFKKGKLPRGLLFGGVFVRILRVFDSKQLKLGSDNMS